jgi:hypothetical protein
MPQLKKHHHYVPQFWIRAFRDGKDRLHCREGKGVKVVAARKVMQEDWLYTLFDQHWIPSDDLENELAVIEGSVAPIFDSVHDFGYRVSEEEREQLCEFLGLQASRHPDILKLGIRRASEFADVLARAHEFSVSEFIEQTKSGMNAKDATACYYFLTAKSPAELRSQFEEVRTASPQNPRLPMQDALRAYKLIAGVISKMDLTLLDAPQEHTLVLGDTPMPQFDLQKGFRIPLSKSVALEARAGIATGAGLSRRQASIAEVQEINHEQWANAKRIVVGPDPAVLHAL